MHTIADRLAASYFDAIETLCGVTPKGWYAQRGTARAAVTHAGVATLNAVYDTTAEPDLGSLDELATEVGRQVAQWSIIVRGEADDEVRDLAARHGLLKPGSQSGGAHPRPGNVRPPTRARTSGSDDSRSGHDKGSDGVDLARPAGRHRTQDRFLARGAGRALLPVPRRGVGRDARLAQGRTGAPGSEERRAGLPDRPDPPVQADAEAERQLETTVRLDSVSVDDFDTVFYPGGHGPLWDLAEDKNSIKLIEQVVAAGKPIALVCHAPGALRHCDDARRRAPGCWASGSPASPTARRSTWA